MTMVLWECTRKGCDHTDKQMAGATEVWHTVNNLGRPEVHKMRQVEYPEGDGRTT